MSATDERGLQGLGIGFAGSNPDNLTDIEDKNLSITDLAGVGDLANGADCLFGDLVGHGDLDFDFRHEVNLIFGAAVDFRMAPLAAKSLYLAHRHAGDIKR